MKDTGDVHLQDFAATYKFSPAFQLEGGLLLMEQSYNHNQSAATLLGIDYGSYTFVGVQPPLLPRPASMRRCSSTDRELKSRRPCGT